MIKDQSGYDRRAEIVEATDSLISKLGNTYGRKDIGVEATISRLTILKESVALEMNEYQKSLYKSRKDQ